MPNPNITQTTPNSPYNITNSKGLMADLVLSAGALETRFINLSMATAAAGLVIELVQNGPPIRIVAISGGMGSDSTVPGFEVSWSSATAGTITTVNINIRDVSGGGFSSVPWTLRAKASAPGTWTFEPDPAAFLSRVMCDPIASMSSSVAGQVPEKSAVTLTASSATIGTVLGGPSPIVSYRFASIGPTAVSPLPVCSASPFVTFNTPGCTRRARSTSCFRWPSPTAPAPAPPG